MAFIRDKVTGLSTVGEVIAALQRFPADMRCSGSLDERLNVYRLEPDPEDVVADPRGEIVIDS